MRLDIKRKMLILGISFFTTVIGLYYFISNYYVDERLNKIVNEKYSYLEETILNEIESQVLGLENLNNEIFFKDESYKEKNEKYFIYEIKNESLNLIHDGLEINEEIKSKLINRKKEEIGIFLLKGDLIGTITKEYNDIVYIIGKELYSLSKNNEFTADNLYYDFSYLNDYKEEIKKFSSLTIKKVIPNNENYINSILIKNCLLDEGYIGIKVNSTGINSRTIIKFILLFMFAYGVLIFIYGLIFFKMVNKKFFVKIETLENRIKKILNEPENPSEIVRQLNLDSIDYIENNIDNMISSVNEYKEIVNYYAKYDSLTALLNRETFIKEGDNEIEKENILALVYINLDGFSYYNNNFGYVKGDEILREVSKTILEYNKNKNMVARIGGDEFAVLIQKTSELEEITIYAEKLIEKINAITVHEKGNFVSASLGICLKSENEKNTVELINNAYLAMVTVKEKRKNSYEIYSPCYKNEITIGMIQKALEDGDIQIHYQPKVNVKTNEIDGVEALVRWFDKEKGYISPLDFIKVAEDTGYIITFGEWIFRNAVRDIKKLNNTLQKDLTVAINVSAIQFMQKNFVDKVEKILIEEEILAKNIEIELTESIGIFNSTYVTNTFDRLSELGISIAIDDFGTGYSCIKYLKEFKINTIKIDKTFVQGGGKNISLIKYIIDVCKILGFSVVAEGIEEYRQARVLKNLSCDYMQGYFFYKPMPIQKLYEVIKSDEVIEIK
ncbi:MAG: putative bifunctional diguanylate cyclase/phosphodiesterase [Sarcina sp.]